MLKNKKAIYILIPLNLIIWSFFIYRFYTGYNAQDIEIDQTNFVAETKPAETKDSIGYKLQLNYEDPFLKNQIKVYASTHQDNAEKSQNKALTNARSNMLKQTNAIQKPAIDIKYIGLIKNTETGFITALVSMNGVSQLVKEKEIIEGITFKKFTKDSLIAFAGKEKIVVKR
jgi:hypothetical protein